MYLKIIRHYVLLLVLISSLQSQSMFHVLTTNSPAAEGYFYKGISELQIGDKKNAADLFEAALKIDSSFVLAAIFRWKTGIGGYMESEKYYSAGIAETESISDYEKGLITILTNPGDNRNIESEIIRLAANYNHDVQFLYYLGNYYFEKDQVNEALGYYEKCSQYEPDNMFWYAVYGGALMYSGNYEYSERLLKKYISKKPQSPIGYRLLGELYFRKAEVDNSVIHYKSALEKDKTYLPAYRGLGKTYASAGKFELAKDCYQSMFDYSTDITDKLEALKLLADCEVYEGDIKQALTISNISEKLALKYNLVKEAADCYNHMGYIKIHAGQYDEGMREFEKADRTIELSSISEELKEKYNTIASINRCYVLTSKGMLDQAEQEAAISAKMVEENGSTELQKELNAKLALLALKKGDDSRAIDLLSKSKLDYYSLSQIGSIYNSKGNKDKAKYFYNLADEKWSFTTNISDIHSIN